MAAPEYVPRPAAEQARVYQSPPRRPDSWTNNRPGDFNSRQPLGPRLGSPGPDQGYALKLARSFEGKLVLTPGEHETDAMAGGVAVATKRASLFGRAPVIHDLTVAFTVWGFLADAPPELVTLRGTLFEEASHPHHYQALREIADLVPDTVLRMLPEQVKQASASDWRSLIELPTKRQAPLARRAFEPSTRPTPSATVPAPEPEPVVAEPEPIVAAAPAPAPPAPAPPAPAPAPPVEKATPPPVPERKAVAPQVVVKKKDGAAEPTPEELEDLVAQAKRAFRKKNQG